MMKNRPVWMRFAVPIAVFALVLLVEDGLINLFPTATWLYEVLFLTALGGAFIMSTFLPHPRQERKRQEAQAKLKFVGESSPGMIANATTGIFIPKESEETLAEKRP